MIKRIIFFIFIISFVCACSKHDNKLCKTVLFFDSTISHVQEKKLIRDSIVINHFSNDSIVFLKYYDGDFAQFNYFYKNDKLFEKRLKGSFGNDFLGIDSILTFSKKDTTFLYHYNRFLVMVTDYSYADCIYIIKNKGNEYITIKQSTIDTTYKEIFFYDKNFNIYKYINTWKGNKYVYIKKKSDLQFLSPSAHRSVQ